jgi:hypothetical protein
MPDPKDAGSILPDPLGTGSASPDPLGAGLATSDPLGKGSTSLDLRDAESTSYGGTGSYEGSSPSPTTTNMGCRPRAMPLTLGSERVPLDVTDGRHRLRLGTHISNSAGWTNTVLIDPRVTLDKGNEPQLPSSGACL